jgi:hypothetical protein
VREYFAILLFSALIVLSGDQSEAARFPRIGGGNIASFAFSYPPSVGPALPNGCGTPGPSISFTNAFGTFAWTNHQVEDPGVTPHEECGMWFVTLTPAGGGAAQQFTLPNGFGAYAMAQDNSVSHTVYLEQGDAIWYAFLGWSLTPSSNLLGEPVFLPAGPLQVPTVTGPFTPSPDSMTPITAPVGTLTSVEGVWTWGAADTGGDFFLLLNGATTGVSAHTLTIESNGTAFAAQAHTGSNKVFIGYQFSSGGSPTVGPVPRGIAYNPSYYSGQTICFTASTTCAPHISRAALGGANVAGHFIANATVTLSDGTTRAINGTDSFFNNPPTTATAAFQVASGQIQLSRALTVADDSATTGGPQAYFTFPVQNGVTMNAGWFQSNVDVGP